MDLNRKKNDVASGPGFRGRSTSKMSSEVEKQLRQVDTEAGSSANSLLFRFTGIVCQVLMARV